ncbi:unnamed protein product [Hymenolepis diminuta]|uniref:G_PROTEIN_RECEP_F3_4 domain-containing protein n=1 Tax=Hymenolepis diminuta TaxID=6216 RepID=A0A0R3SDF7_HYMDI|nr:unnamed protein product [Hymenolepis diminuta]
MFDKKSQLFYFDGPEDEKTLKTLKPQISKFLSEYCISEVDADNLADEIVKVINSDEQFHSQVLGFIKESGSAELAIYETLNALVSSKNSENESQDGEEVAGGNPNKKLFRDRRAAPPVGPEFNHLPGAKRKSALEDAEKNDVIDPDLEDGDVIPEKEAPKKLPDKLVPSPNDPVPVPLDNTQDENDPVEPKKDVQNDNLPVVRPPIPNSDEKNSQQGEDAKLRLKANAEDKKDLSGGAQLVRGKADHSQNQNEDVNLRNANGNGQSVADNDDKEKQVNDINLGERGVNPKPDLSANAGGNELNPSNYGVRQKVDASKLNKQGEQDVKVGRENKENSGKLGNGKPQNDAPQVDKPSLNEPQLLNQQEGGTIHKQQGVAKEDHKKGPAEVGQKPPEVPEPPPRPHISDFTANIIKEATTSFIQNHQGGSFPYTFVNEKASINFTVRFTSSSEIGAYDLVFHNCRKTAIDASIIMVEKNGDNYLSLGEQPLAILFGIFSLIYVCLAIVWGFHLRFSKAPVFRMHHLMLAMVIVKSISLMFHSINYYVIGRHGVQEEGWAVMYYIAHMTRGFLLIVTILMIGAGWTFIKHVFTRQEKQVFAVVIPLQVFANIATIVINETEQGATRFALWNEIFTIVDLLCCAGVLFPVIWSIRHLRQAAQSDGKVAQNLRKLRLFRHFYILVICYIYFTRIIVYLLRMTTPFAWSWLVELFEQSVTLVFFVSVGCKFRPFNDNPYLQLPTSDDTEDVVMQRFDVEEAWSQSGMADGITRIHRPQGLDTARENRRRRDDAPNRPLPSEPEAGDSDLLPLIRP